MASSCGDMRSADTARTRDGIAPETSAIVDIVHATALRNGAIQHSKVGGWCQDGMTMIIREVPMFAYIAEQRDTRERRSIATLTDFAFEYSPTVTNSASEVLLSIVTRQASSVALQQEDDGAGEDPALYIKRA